MNRRSFLGLSFGAAVAAAVPAVAAKPEPHYETVVLPEPAAQVEARRILRDAATYERVHAIRQMVDCRLIDTGTALQMLGLSDERE